MGTITPFSWIYDEDERPQDMENPQLVAQHVIDIEAKNLKSDFN